ncbi:MAG: integrase arm-type DNA-binding domain-containing protein [Immundisolibacteraceae bacterium]|nr:integrase arm-type DNA-binding domain-containing protein [Immundisolibacteraceae bacterium]
MAAKKLSDTTVRQAVAKERDYKLFDGNGLYLLVKKNGSRYWRYKYRFGGKEKTLALGVYPRVTLKQAREAHHKAVDMFAKGIDPGLAKQLSKLSIREASENSFEAVGHEWLAKHLPNLSVSHTTRVRRITDMELFPFIGHRPIGEITPPELLAALRRVESRGAIESAHRAKQVAGQIFRYAVATGRAERDPSQDLRGALAAPKKTHLAAITDPKEVGPLLLVLDGYKGTPEVRAALRLAPLTFARPGELRHAEWAEIDFDQAEWRIAGEKMKTGNDHIVPLARQSVDALREIEPLTGHGRYVFPSARSLQRPMSENAVLGALRRLGIPKGEMTGHGFRAMARTILDEVLGYRVDWIEHQLAHAVKDVNGRAYNRTKHLGQRREMMQRWADYLDQLRIEANSSSVVTANFGATR